jgi:5-methylcytosine-specific restriction endonuclease McrA
LKAVVHDGVEIRTVRHFGRHLPAELRTALDPGPAPRFLGRACIDCGRTYGLEYDHVIPAANNGPTSFENVVARCRADHREKTARDRNAGLLGRKSGRAGPDPPQRPGRARPE